MTVIRNIFYDERTVAFLLGMGIEAAGLAIQFELGMPAYPILDAAVVFVLIAILWYFQRKKNAEQS
jgi:hypothetical protein